ncbi:unnamed protein product [Rotaria sordida]|uniref:Uncharacterized protein n=1 Tax=Rotaria sordida TaxID=392033 RepID=A0A815H9Q5_9BILA|nr:unnamed protein product [Rotaria sordida]CAF1469817.1 unnamed protein product [Rotaria sordida]CAF1512663.1 unnamed protein product [Rotaria sordida]CAF3869739.1 unnamed protein product [Rotaria sordida]CAF4013902.1 unnamed protein product [Rotaria sordida]
MSIKNSSIPDDIMKYEYKRFFDFVKDFSGERVASLLEYQDLSNVECLLACQDPLEILSLDSDDLLELKKKTCIKLNDNSYAILPGIKSKMNILTKALLKKYNELKKEASKISSNITMTNNLSTTALTTTNSVRSSDQSSRILEPISSLSNTSSTAETRIKQHIKQLINDWCKRTIENENSDERHFQLIENRDYEIIIDIVSTKVVIRCECGAVSTLGQKDKNYVLSNYIRHLTKSNPCPMVQQKLKEINENSITDVGSTRENTNTSVDVAIDPTSSLPPSTQTSLMTRKRTKEFNPLLMKKMKKK